MENLSYPSWAETPFAKRIHDFFQRPERFQAGGIPVNLVTGTLSYDPEVLTLAWEKPARHSGAFIPFRVLPEWAKDKLESHGFSIGEGEKGVWLEDVRTDLNHLPEIPVASAEIGVLLEKITPKESFSIRTIRSGYLVLGKIFSRMDEIISGTVESKPVPEEIEKNPGILDVVGKVARGLFSPDRSFLKLADRKGWNNSFVDLVRKVNRIQIDDITGIRIGANILDGFVRATGFIPPDVGPVQFLTALFSNVGSVLAEKLPEIMREATPIPPHVLFSGDRSIQFHKFFADAAIMAGMIEDGVDGVFGKRTDVDIEEERPVTISFLRNLSYACFANYEKYARNIQDQDDGEECSLGPGY